MDINEAMNIDELMHINLTVIVIGTSLFERQLYAGEVCFEGVRGLPRQNVQQTSNLSLAHAWQHLQSLQLNQT